MICNIFKCYGETPDKQQFTKTIEALSGFISKTIDFLKDAASICRKLELEPIQDHVDPMNKESKCATKKLIWKINVQTYIHRVEAQEKNC